MREFRLYVAPEPVELDYEALDARAAGETSVQMSRVIAAGTTYEDLSRALEAEYGGNLQRASADVDTFLATLREHGVPEH